MAAEEIGIKTPEGDGAKPSAVSEDTSAPSAPTMGEHCVTDPPLAAGDPSGEISKIADIDVYISKPSDYPHGASKLLLFLSNGTGIHSKNNQIQADKYASEGYLVVMPDQFGGDPAPNRTTVDDQEQGAEQKTSMLERIQMGFADTAKSFLLDMWLARQTPEKVLPLLHKVIEGAKEEFADAVSNGGGVYAVGYCFGGKYVLLLGSELPDTIAQGQATVDEEKGVVKSGPQIKAGAIAHGTLIGKEDLEGLLIPVTMACTENDQLFPDDAREAGQKSLVERKVEHEIKVYPGMPHGFAVLGDYEDEKIQEAQKDAFQQMVQWITMH